MVICRIFQLSSFPKKAKNFKINRKIHPLNFFKKFTMKIFKKFYSYRHPVDLQDFVVHVQGGLPVDQAPVHDPAHIAPSVLHYLRNFRNFLVSGQKIHRFNPDSIFDLSTDFWGNSKKKYRPDLQRGCYAYVFCFLVFFRIFSNLQSISLSFTGSKGFVELFKKKFSRIFPTFASLIRFFMAPIGFFCRILGDTAPLGDTHNFFTGF